LVTLRGYKELERNIDTAAATAGHAAQEDGEEDESEVTSIIYEI
jgi:hypothetical protein